MGNEATITALVETRKFLGELREGCYNPENEEKSGYWYRLYFLLLLIDAALEKENAKGMQNISKD